MREIRTSGSTRGEVRVLNRFLSYSTATRGITCPLILRYAPGFRRVLHAFNDAEVAFRAGAERLKCLLVSLTSDQT